MDKSSIVDMVKDNIAAFLFGWVVGAGLWPVLWEQLTNL